MRFENKIIRLLSDVDIQVNGDRDWDIQVHNPNLYRRVLANGSLGFGEAYMEGWWDCARLDQFFHRALSAKLERKIFTFVTILDGLKSRLFNPQSLTRAFDVGKKHYSIGNDLYKSMLDERLIYSCGYWKDAKTLDEAQTAKLDLVCRKLHIRPGMKVLDIGCGWGGAAKFVAENYDVEVVGITISEAQLKLGKEICRGLPVELRLQDYRSLTEKFDRIFSIGMFEHVGYKNYAAYFRVVHRCLKKDGLFLLHTIGKNWSSTTSDTWINRYIFTNSMIPSFKQLCRNINRTFVMEDWHNFGTHYDTTLMHWYQNFQNNWDSIKHNYDQAFYRMWCYYLLMCAGSFRAMRHHLWQIALSDGVNGGYQSVR